MSTTSGEAPLILVEAGPVPVAPADSVLFVDQLRRQPFEGAQLTEDPQVMIEESVPATPPADFKITLDQFEQDRGPQGLVLWREEIVQVHLTAGADETPGSLQAFNGHGEESFLAVLQRDRR
jgi:hypothetical protein